MKENLISSATQAEQKNQVLSVDLIALFKYLLQKDYERPVPHILMQENPTTDSNWTKWTTQITVCTIDRHLSLSSIIVD